MRALSQTADNNQSYGYQFVNNENNSKKLYRSSRSMIEEVPNTQLYQKPMEYENRNNSYQKIYQDSIQNLNYQNINNNSSSNKTTCYADKTTKKLLRTMSMVDYQESYNRINASNKNMDNGYNFNVSNYGQEESNQLYYQMTCYNNNNPIQQSYMQQSLIEKPNTTVTTSQFEVTKSVQKNVNNSPRISAEVFIVMNSMLSIFDSLDLIVKNKNFSKDGIFPSHVISSVFAITVGENL